MSESKIETRDPYLADDQHSGTIFTCGCKFFEHLMTFRGGHVAVILKTFNAFQLQQLKQKCGLNTIRASVKGTLTSAIRSELSIKYV